MGRLFLVVDGSFGDWTEWGACSVTCGVGQSVRRRLCDHPVPQNGGKDCEGPAEEFKACNDVACPVPTPGPGKLPALITAHIRSLGKGNVFTPVCHSFSQESGSP